MTKANVLFFSFSLLVIYRGHRLVTRSAIKLPSWHPTCRDGSYHVTLDIGVVQALYVPITPVLVGDNATKEEARNMPLG